VTEFGKLTKKAKDFLKDAEDDIGSPVTLISTGPEMTQIIDLREEQG
jgi:adenylosuccinate synthase